MFWGLDRQRYALKTEIVGSQEDGRRLEVEEPWAHREKAPREVERLEKPLDGLHQEFSKDARDRYELAQ